MRKVPFFGCFDHFEDDSNWLKTLDALGKTGDELLEIGKSRSASKDKQSQNRQKNTTERLPTTESNTREDSLFNTEERKDPKSTLGTIEDGRLGTKNTEDPRDESIAPRENKTEDELDMQESIEDIERRFKQKKKNTRYTSRDPTLKAIIVHSNPKTKYPGDEQTQRLLGNNQAQSELGIKSRNDHFFQSLMKT